ncbi:hypothetical protein PROFUN_11142 [Planoprotostelium fungivorum]|uniref:Uncharacterized protein n=1 Tax=Planoprotostelium fungivorum TaxID=1890364 RepID=A0A2P6NAT2_9EUKA|nr:hypothetical protein PROFUN_11142 [Planoprotostelium fungivorum]
MSRVGGTKSQSIITTVHGWKTQNTFTARTQRYSCNKVTSMKNKSAEVYTGPPERNQCGCLRDYISYSDFINQLKSISREELTDPSRKKKKTTQQTYDELNLDFPLVNEEDLNAFTDDLLKQMSQSSPSYPLKRSFFCGVEYNSAKKSQDSGTNVVPISAHRFAGSSSTDSYRKLAAILFVKTPRHLLTLNEQQLSDRLKEYQCENSDSTTDSVWKKLEDILIYDNIDTDSVWTPGPFYILEAHEEKSIQNVSSQPILLIKDRMLVHQKSTPSLLPPLVQFLKAKDQLWRIQTLMLTLSTLCTQDIKSKPIIACIIEQIESSFKIFDSEVKRYGETETTEALQGLSQILHICEFYSKYKTGDVAKHLQSTGLFSSLSVSYIYHINRICPRPDLKELTDISQLHLSSDFDVLPLLCLRSSSLTSNIKTTEGFLQLLNENQVQDTHLFLLGWNLVWYAHAAGADQAQAYLQSADHWLGKDLLDVVAGEWKEKTDAMRRMMRALALLKAFSSTEKGKKVLRGGDSLLNSVIAETPMEAQGMTALEEKNRNKIVAFKQLLKELLPEGKAE